MLTEQLKSLVKENKSLKNIRIISSGVQPLMPRIAGTKTDCRRLQRGIEYQISFSYERAKDTKSQIDEIVERVIKNLPESSVICYKASTRNVLKHTGGIYYWNSKVEDTGRDACDIFVLTDEGANHSDKPLIDKRVGWVVLKPESVHLIGQD